MLETVLVSGTAVSAVVVVAVYAMRQSEAHARRVERLAHDCMDRLHAGAFSDFVAHAEQHDAAASVADAAGEAGERPFDPDLMPEEEYQDALKRAEAGYAEIMGAPL